MPYLPMVIICLFFTTILGCNGSSSDNSEENTNEVTEYQDVLSSLSYMTDYPVGVNVERTIAMTVWFPEQYDELMPVIIVSHGGMGSINGHRQFLHLAKEYASNGYVSIHINHPTSKTTGNESQELAFHLWDRPSDVIAVLNALENDTLSLGSLTASLDLNSIGFIGHSLGAYTGHAVAGGRFVDPTNSNAEWGFHDERIKAVVLLSPQGFDAFGSFDEEHSLDMTSSLNSWQDINVPSYCFVGEAEKDGVAGVSDLTSCPECFRLIDWRLFPFYRYPLDGTRYLSIIPMQNHHQMGEGGSDEVKEFISKNSRMFFDFYLKSEGEADKIGDENNSVGAMKYNR